MNGENKRVYLRFLEMHVQLLEVFPKVLSAREEYRVHTHRLGFLEVLFLVVDEDTLIWRATHFLKRQLIDSPFRL